MTRKKSCWGHFYLGNWDETTDPPNGPILNTMGILANVMSAASEAEAAALFTNKKEGVIQRIALEEMQWPQPPTPITVDNSTAAGLGRDTIKANKSGPWTCTSTGSKTGPNNVSS